MSARMKSRYKPEFLQFEARVLEAIASFRNVDPLILCRLSEDLCKLKRYREALRIDKQLVKRYPKDPVFRYNLACSYTQLRRYNHALRELNKAFKLGFKDKEHLYKDRDLRLLVQKHGKSLCRLLKKFTGA